MQELKICFTGIGSIAKRHIKNLRIISRQRGICMQIDAYRREQGGVDGIDKVYTDFLSIPNNYDVIFITNPTNMHLNTLSMFHNKGRHFFIEKPVVSLGQIDEAMKFSLRNNSVYYVACPLRYNSVIQYIKTAIDSNDVISVRSISSSYLPDWRKGQDYRDTYSAHKNMGGGVSIDLIHEWDYLIYLFGCPQTVKSIIGKKSQLEIDSDDYAIYIAEYTNKIVELHLDYFGRKTRREVELFTKDDTILGDIANNKITFLKRDQILDFREERDDYQKRELEYFIDMVVGDGFIEDGYHHGIDVLKISQGMKEII